MKRLVLFTWLFSALAYGGETLPDQARLSDEEKDQDTQQRFAAPVMAAEELEQLYLQSPVEIGESTARAMRSVQGESLYSDSDAQFQERQRTETRVAPPSELTPPPPVPATLPAGVPIRQL
ncbi:MAG: hypothetical protein P1U78_01920 [Alcanivoracaceae bacterium]|nr:hypothetical protein [Alcanivoracaceae bacterium]